MSLVYTRMLFVPILPWRLEAGFGSVLKHSELT